MKSRFVQLLMFLIFNKKPLQLQWLFYFVSVEFLYMKILQKNSESIAKLANLLRSGEVVAFPTETVYGLGANAFDDNAVQKIFTLKGRPSDNPLIVHIASMDDLPHVVRSVPDWTKKLMEKFWPGPISFVLPVSTEISQLATARLDTVAVRMPNHLIALELIKASRAPLVAPSANISGKPSPTTIFDVEEDFKEAAIYGIDGGLCDIGIESTVLLCLPDSGTILRPGIISREKLQIISDVPIHDFKSDQQDAPRSPGTKYRHYAPQAQVVLIDEFPNDSENSWCCIYNENRSDCIELSEQNLYHTFREADRKRVEKIYILDTPKLQQNKGLYNRIQKATLG